MPSKRSARDRFRAYIADKGLSNATAGKLFGCVPSYVAGLKNGTVASPGLALAARIEEVTGIECSAWVHDKDRERRKAGAA